MQWCSSRFGRAASSCSWCAGQGPPNLCVLDGRKISAERNQTRELPDATAHAEMMAIRRACESIGAVELRGATLYSTLQP
ncbi:MAG: nucleoside deaminase, partial [Sandarakinorhabdus sp.]|nr:nucleoside deaminase [Sandarakinorhabdus sp.]